MDKEINILVVCTHEGIMATILRLIHSHSALWHATGAESAAQALEMSDQDDYDIVLLGNGLTEQEEQELTQTFTAKNGQTKLIKHYGGGSGLLFGEVYQALNH